MFIFIDYIMRLPSLFLRYSSFSGVLASITFWVFTIISITHNSWFDLSRHAFSDLGGPQASDPWIYNTGLVVSAIFIEFLSINMIISSNNKTSVISGSYLSIAGVFLVLVAIYPAGTKPHTFVSTWFFIQAFIAALIYGLSIIRERPFMGLAIVLIFIAGLLGSMASWPSTALLETYEILLLTIFSIIYAYILTSTHRIG